LTDILKEELEANEYSLIIVGYDGRVVKKILSKCDIPVMAIHSYEIKQQQQLRVEEGQAIDLNSSQHLNERIEEETKRHDIRIPISALLSSSETGSHSRQLSRRSSFGPDIEPTHRTGANTPPMSSSRESSPVSTPRIGPSPEYVSPPSFQFVCLFVCLYVCLFVCLFSSKQKENEFKCHNMKI
jgi:hypothetical protein